MLIKLLSRAIISTLVITYLSGFAIGVSGP
jgi:hypothetical protein